jgi:hypothetical protein
MKVFFISFVNVKFISFDCDEIKTTKKIKRKLAIHQARAQGLRVAKKLAWRFLLLSKKRCVEKGKDDYVLKLFEILCFQNGNTS